VPVKHWFPFTDYDFYAYLTAGLTVLFALDFSANHGAIMLREEWPFVQIVFAVAVAYLVGQIIAGFASMLLEHWLARRVLQPPITVLLELQKPRKREKFVNRWIVGRYYEALPPTYQVIILENVAAQLGLSPDALKDPEEVFQVAFPVARSAADAAARLDDFRKLYGFSRNMSLAAAIAAGALIYRAVSSGDSSMYGWAAVIGLGSVALFARFLKFYAAFAAEVLRTYAHDCKRTKQ